jgi:hypothetical protein
MCPYGSDREKRNSAKAKGFFSRLFPPPANPHLSADEEKLIRLGQSMRYTIEREGTHTPRVGFTYFGQFVGHDLTHDPTPLDGPYLEAEKTPNFRSPYLNLEQLYGGGPEVAPQLYEGEPGAEVFKTGRTDGEGYQRDLPIQDGQILIADQRNLDNLIIRQLHSLFLKFHNEAVRQLSRTTLRTSDREDVEADSIFCRAQRLVQWHYQWIVRHDFLPRIVDDSFWRQPKSKQNRHHKNGFSIPIEFSLAAFRFGHSMVRKAYGLNCRQPRVELPELMRLGHQPSPISDDYLIEWGRFFDGLPHSGPVASSSYLDTSLVLPMHGIPDPVIRLGIQHEVLGSQMNLPVRTLLRGARARLPSGQEVARRLTETAALRQGGGLGPATLARKTGDESGDVLRDLRLDRNTPLFYYLLKEAELIAGGRTLGPVGSQIVGNTILASLRADPEGYLAKAGLAWTLPRWRFPSGTWQSVHSLIQVIRLVGDHHLLPECDRKWRSLHAAACR